jgi:eukaryotic-like serine/threonine-protein kinase
MSASEKSPRKTVADSHSWETPPMRDLTDVTLGDFQVERLLGRGGMGEVYLARQISLNRRVALKVLRPDLLTKPVYLSRFQAEATTVAKLNHPNIVIIYTLGNVDDTRFIAMEYVQGKNLREYLNKKGVLDLALALSIMRQTAVAIGAAGELGLVHRDIKPENLLLTRKGQVKVADFGLCRDQDTERVDLTQPGITLGTPLYMSPEQAQGHPLDHRSDLYSMGVTFYHMLAGEPPFKAETPLALALKHVKDTPVSLAVYRPDLPPELVGLVMKLIAKSPDNRYQSADEMLRDLSRIKGSLITVPITLAEADPGPASAAGDRSAELAAISMASRARAWRDGLSGLRLGGRGLAAVVGLCLVAGLARGWLTRSDDLLSEGTAPAGSALPALWMSPRWGAIVRKGGPEEQYRHAQLGASLADQEAAWLAVPGYFPEARAWDSQAYIQLGRILLRRRDADRLRVFATEIGRWNATQSHEHENELVTILQAATKALDGDQEGVIVQLNQLNLPSTIDAALLELALEVTVQSTHSASRTGPLLAVPPGLKALQSKLLGQLSTVEISEQLGRRRSG